MINAGIDWAEKHPQQYVILNKKGQPLKEGSFDRSVDGVYEFISALRDLEPHPAQVRIGIDRKHDIITQVLVAEGYRVFPINPKSSDRARDCFRPAGGKDDRTDARVHAEMVRTSFRRMEALQPQKELDRQLKGLLRLRQRYVKMRSQQKQILGSLISQISPTLRSLCGAFRRDWVRDMLEEFPLHQDLCEAHGNQLNRFLREHRMSAETKQDIRAVRGQTPVIFSDQEADTYRKQIHSLLSLICSFDEEIEKLDERVSILLEQHPDAEIFRSLPSGSDVTLGALIAAFGADRDDTRSWRQYAAYFGTSPITEQSGGSRSVHKRRAYDSLSFRALENLADATRRRAGCWASTYYQRKRAEGKGYYHALRCLAHRWVKILHAMWRNRTLYDEAYHTQRRKCTGSP